MAALLDTGSHGDFVSTTLADQLRLTLNKLDKPLPCQLAASGSRTVIQHQTTVQFQFQEVNEQRTFDIMNMDGYQVILGTPFLFQH
jgi:hypothetical protein